MPQSRAGATACAFICQFDSNKQIAARVPIGYDKRMTELTDILRIDDETCWRAVVARDTSWDGQFVYGVRSTGIYCRPGCPARRPRRDQVTFFASGAAARAAGLRACRRCRPDADVHDDLAGRARRLLDEAEENIGLVELADRAGASPSHLLRAFKAAFGVTPRQYAAARRLERLKAELQHGQDVTTAIYAAGYNSPSRVYERVGRDLGMTPGVYRGGGAGMQITYTIFETSLGWLLLAASPRGICRVAFGANAPELEQELALEFPRAERQRADEYLKDWAAALQAQVRGEPAPLELPLDVQGTDFQMRVWQALRRIPAGETRTYAQLAESIGQPRAVRAAAHACAANPAAVIIPCHRIVRSGGGLGGYHWGLERKRKLLEAESPTPQPPPL